MLWLLFTSLDAHMLYTFKEVGSCAVVSLQLNIAPLFLFNPFYTFYPDVTRVISTGLFWTGLVQAMTSWWLNWEAGEGKSEDWSSHGSNGHMSDSFAVTPIIALVLKLQLFKQVTLKQTEEREEYRRIGSGWECRRGFFHTFRSHGLLQPELIYSIREKFVLLFSPDTVDRSVTVSLSLDSSLKTSEGLCCK